MSLIYKTDIIRSKAFKIATVKNTETTSPASVMIVEDEVDLCYLLVKILKQSNLKADCVYSISEAKQTIKKLNPSIIFIDNFLPDGYGSDFIQNIKEGHPKSKIVMITAHDSPADIEKAFKRGADYFITKPFNTKTVKNTLKIMGYS